MHPARVEVPVQRVVLHGRGVKGIPRLPPQRVAGDGLEVALVGELQDVDAAGGQDAGDLAHERGKVLGVVEHADGEHGIK